MNFIRSILPGGKHRMMSENKSLDIAKITPRMYAMSYPSDSFIESMYHNSQEDIAEYLNKNHPKKYLIFNLSGITYDSEKFNNSVITYHWPDHKAPPLYDIFNIILQAYKYLGKDKENVICVHCLAGKGRTGTICCSLLLYGKLLKTSNEANDYFSTKRFKKLNKGVQEPSQVRYLKYFDIMLDSKKFKGLELKMFEIQRVDITGVKLSDGESITYKIETNNYKENESKHYISKDKGQIVAGDVTINIYRNGTLKAWIFFNTLFLDFSQNRLFFNVNEIDPRFLKKESDYSLMSVDVMIKPFFPEVQNNDNDNDTNNNDDNNINDNEKYIDEMIENEIERIKKMNELIYYANNKDPNVFYNENKNLFFGDEKDDINEVMSEINK